MADAGKVDLLITGGTVVDCGRSYPMWIAVKNGKIAALGTSKDTVPTAKETIDASGKHVLPGVIDMEHHPAQPIKECMETETRAAAASGTTTGGIMGVSGRVMDPPIDLDCDQEIPSFAESIPRFNSMMNGRSMFDYFWAPELNSPRIIRDIPVIAEKLGVTTYKLYLHTMGGERMWDMWAPGKARGDSYYDDGDVFWAMKTIASIGTPLRLVLHCENWFIGRIFMNELTEAGRTRVVDYLDRSPNFTEAGMIRTWAYYANVAKCPITIVHTTTPESVKEIELAKSEGTDIAGNVQPHYLILGPEYGVINVPLRSEEGFECMWEAVRKGTIDSVSSDSVWNVVRTADDVDTHGLIPNRSWEWKEAFFNGSNGFLLPIMLSEGVNKGRISIERLVELCCENPARLNGLYPKKGTLQIGADADIVVVDLNKTKKLTRDMVHTKVGWSIYEGREIKGWPIMTILRGKVLMRWTDGTNDREIVADPMGEYIPRQLGRQLYAID
jgi:dihydropyrimidinase/dihydroorotase